MNDREKFLKLIEKDPYDLVTRKVYADWLDEYGNDSDFELAEEQRKWTKEKQHAIVWMTELAEYITQEGKEFSYDNPENYKMTYEQLIEIGKNCIEKEWESHSFNGFDTPDRLLSEMTKFWKNFELITGISVKNKNKRIFLCSC